MSTAESTEGRPSAARAPQLTMSVVIATYGRPSALAAALDSLRRQSRPPDEVVVAMWAGDEAALSLIQQLAAQGHELASPAMVQVVTTQNTVAAKENAAIEVASGDIVCFMDDDAIARPDWLKRIENHYLDPSVGAVGGRDVVWINGRVVERQARDVGRVSWFGRLTANHHDRTSGVRDVDFLKGCNMSFRREVLSPIDRRLLGAIPYGFEIDMGLAVRRLGMRIVYDPETRVDHYPSTHYGSENAALSRVVNHNQTYVLLKQLAWPRKLTLLLYTFLIGDKNTIGLLRIPWLVWRERWSAHLWLAHLAGKLAGIRSYIDFCTEARRR